VAVLIRYILCSIRSAFTKRDEFVFPSPAREDAPPARSEDGFMKALLTVPQLLGHSTIAMTTRYAHSSVDAKINAVERFD
jgi:hypothetical protein